jgi:beta-glucanase (GH16 family)
MSADAFRFIVANHRYVYGFDTWPSKGGGEFAFDLKGRGEGGQTVTLSSSAKGEKLTQATLTDEHGQSYHALGGLGDIGNGQAAEQTIKFARPVWACGVTYQSPADATLDASSYTLTDGTVVNVSAGGTIAANSRTFVGVMDDTDKGIASVTFRVRGSMAGQQALYIKDLAFAFVGPPPGDWKLTLEDNFDGDKLNDRNWTPGYTYKDIINNELQAYVPENITVANGQCTIKVEHREAVNTDRTGRTGATQKFASGAFTSFDKFTQTYGYFEARIKMPHARGAAVWPAFWVLPDRGRDFPEKVRASYMTKENGRGMEIDIFEFMPNWKRSDGTFPIHVGCIWNYGKVTPESPAPHGYGAYGLDNDGWGPEEIHLPDLDTKFHTYGLYWSPERLIWFVDSKPIYRAKNPDRMPNVAHYFLFNIALSGNAWGKTPDKKNPTMEQIIADMPNAMEIDYFRAYSGVLEEATPTSPSDDPRTAVTVTKYTPPAAAPTTKPAEAPKDVPAAPANSQISTPSAG